MASNWLQRWNERYAAKEFAYGTEPNEFLKVNLQNLMPGKILFGAEGEGRNAIYAAKLGWDVSAFDISTAGKNKALALAKENNITLKYKIGQLPELEYENESFDAIALIYAHFPPNLKSKYHQLLSKKLKKGGVIILEAFGKSHLKYREQNPKIGGPATIEALFSVAELKADFEGYHIIELVEKEVELKEGLYHNGVGSVVRFVGRK
ncbi:MAG: methyltransferase domain-containing protein [Bacteroidota bacterium]